MAKTFTSVKALEDYIVGQMKVATESAREIAYMVIDTCLEEFYNDYTPVMYQRERAFLQSLVHTEPPRKTAHGWEADVYFDVNRLKHHSINQEKSEEWIMNTVMVGAYPHGDWEKAGGEGVWVKATREFDANMINYLVNSLKVAGIPVH